MSRSPELAARLRQAIQGCSLHIHGPVQAWAEVMEACGEGNASSREIAEIAMTACRRRVEELRAEGVASDDPRIHKEELTRAFIEKLLLGSRAALESGEHYGSERNSRATGSLSSETSC